MAPQTSAVRPVLTLGRLRDAGTRVQPAMTPARIATALAGIGLVALAVTSAAASSGSEPQAPEAPDSPSTTVIRTAPGQLLLRGVVGAPADAEPLPGTLSSGLTSRHIGG